MTKIQVEVHDAGGVSCLSESCQYQKTCANHVSAGDYRSEDGFSPEISMVGDEFFCLTMERVPSAEYQRNCLKSLPFNVDALNTGMLTLKRIRRDPSPDYYQI